MCEVQRKIQREKEVSIVVDFVQNPTDHLKSVWSISINSLVAIDLKISHPTSLGQMRGL